MTTTLTLYALVDADHSFASYWFTPPRLFATQCRGGVISPDDLGVILWLTQNGGPDLFQTATINCGENGAFDIVGRGPLESTPNRAALAAVSLLSLDKGRAYPYHAPTDNDWKMEAECEKAGVPVVIPANQADLIGVL